MGNLTKVLPERYQERRTGRTGYLSKPCQIDLFESVQVKLEIPMRSNQKDFKPQPYILKRCRKRIEIIFSQLCDQFMLKRNYAMTFAGLGTKIISKVTGPTLLQYINKQNGRPKNKIKYALAL